MAILMQALGEINCLCGAVHQVLADVGSGGVRRGFLKTDKVTQDLDKAKPEGLFLLCFCPHCSCNCCLSLFAPLLLHSQPYFKAFLGRLSQLGSIFSPELHQEALLRSPIAPGPTQVDPPFWNSLSACISYPDRAT